MEAHDCNFRDDLKRCINDRCPLHRSMRALASCLRIAAGLCAAFYLGSDYRMRMMLALPESEDWKPGCGREVTPWPA